MMDSAPSHALQLPSQTEEPWRNPSFSDLQLLAGEDQALLIWGNAWPGLSVDIGRKQGVRFQEVVCSDLCCRTSGPLCRFRDSTSVRLAVVGAELFRMERVTVTSRNHQERSSSTPSLSWILAFNFLLLPQGRG